MKKILSIALLVTIFTASYQLDARNYEIEKINPEINKMTINMGDSFSYKTQAVTPYTGQIINVKLDSKFFSKEILEAKMPGAPTTYKFTSKKQSKKTTMTITRREQPQQKITVIIQK